MYIVYKNNRADVAKNLWPVKYLSVIIEVNKWQIIYWYLLLRGVIFWFKVAPMMPAYLSIPLITGRGIGTKTRGDVFTPDDLWFGSDTYMNCALIYDLHLDVWLIR